MDDVKLFDEWNKEKQAINAKQVDDTLLYKEGEVWVSYLGNNIGREQNGSVENFSRPVLIVKKFNKEMFWGIPLTTKQKNIDYYYNYLDPDKNKVALIIAQVRLMSSKRLERMLYQLKTSDMRAVKLIMINYLAKI